MTSSTGLPQARPVPQHVTRAQLYPSDVRGWDAMTRDELVQRLVAAEAALADANAELEVMRRREWRNMPDDAPRTYLGMKQPGAAPHHYGPDEVAVDGDWVVAVQRDFVACRAQLADANKRIEEMKAKQVGICGAAAPRIHGVSAPGMPICTLPAGHAGWHHDEVSRADWSGPRGESRIEEMTADQPAIRQTHVREGLTPWFELVDTVLVECSCGVAGVLDEGASSTEADAWFVAHVARESVCVAQLAAIRRALDQLDEGDFASSGRDFGRGISFASKHTRAALDGVPGTTQPDDDGKT